ncbi:MAG: SRPBCC family protein [Geodermatophilaceae bacterium]|nr:SRPBCC family protein [Geodermatophilaceae bacterium]
MPEVVAGVDVDAPPEQTWAAITDWERQGEWILATTVRLRSASALGVGTEIEALTGMGKVGIRDRMRVTEWDPPRRCTMQHTGRLIRGRGIFAVAAHRGGSRFTWTEDLELPFGLIGRLGWPLVKLVTRWGLQRSVNRFASFAQSYPAAPPG